MSWSILDGAACRQHALDNDGSDNVKALIRPAGAEADRVRYAGRACRLDEDATVNLVGSAIRHEHETTEAGLDAIRVVVCHRGEIELGGAARCLATRLPPRSRHHAGSRCLALLTAAVPQGPVVLHAGRTARPHPPPVRLRGTGTGCWLTFPTQRNREEAPASASTALADLVEEMKRAGWGNTQPARFRLAWSTSAPGRGRALGRASASLKQHSL